MDITSDICTNHIKIKYIKKPINVDFFWCTKGFQIKNVAPLGKKHTL